MSVTKRHVWLMFMRGWTIARLMKEYVKTVDWIESSIRKYMNKGMS